MAWIVGISLICGDDIEVNGLVLAKLDVLAESCCKGYIG